MSGKEKVIAGKNTVENFFIKKRRSDYYMSWENADMGEGNKDRSYQGKESDAFYGKWQIIGSSKSYKKTYKHK